MLLCTARMVRLLTAFYRATHAFQRANPPWLLMAGHQVTGRAHRVVGVVASPESGGRTSAAVAGLLEGAAEAGCATSLLELSALPVEQVVTQIDEADAVVFGSPVYRATYSALLKQLLESVQRGRHDETTAPLRGKAAAVVMTGATQSHFLAISGVRDVLATFFAVQVLSPGLYVDHAGFVDRTRLSEQTAALAAQQGAALADLTAAVRTSSALSTLEPLV